ncbi:SDR family oxidoreductase [uncultured Roseibium sp.]|uniref:SDR family oxidoreductase n=1 Tax=uncultured Roseibium sp. TaxID=1936171 RepID=UPI003216D117
MTSALKNRVVLITGASRGIGRQIALTAAEQGAAVVIAAKSDTAHAKLPGTIHTVAEEVRRRGGVTLPLRLDVRDDQSIDAVMRAIDSEFGRLDALVNNAGAIRLEGAADLEMKRFDLIHTINTRAVLACSKAALGLLEKSDNAHILSLAPPLNLSPDWLGRYAPYTVTKYGMTLLSLGMAEEFRERRISVNTLWPRTTIATAAVEFEVGTQYLARSRTPQIVADAACRILSTPPGELTGQTLLDETYLRSCGVTEFDGYRHDAEGEALALDLFVDA